MLIREIAYRPSLTKEGAAMVHLDIDGAEYMIVAGSRSVTIIAGRWINDRRSLGRTFWKPFEIVNHYKRHGSELLRQANRIVNW